MVYRQFIKWFPALLLLLFYSSEAFSKYSTVFLDGKSDIQRLIKVIVLGFFVLAIIKPLKNLLLPTLLVIAFCLGQFALVNGFNQEIVVSFSKFLFPIFLFIFFDKYQLSRTSQDILFRTFEYILIFNGALIFLGFVFEISLFNSYKYGRWGYNGLFINTSTSSYIYAIAIFYFLLKLKEKFLKSWMSLFIIVCSLFTGTKIVYVALFGALLLFLFLYNNLNRKQRNAVLLSLLTLFLALGYIFFFQLGIFNEIRQEQGILSAILSSRDELFLNETIPYMQEHWHWPNYLFGGISDLALRSQMGFIDLFLFWGSIGGILYLILFYKTFIPNLTKKNSGYIILTLTLMVFLAGNFFENASLAIYLLILKEILMERSNSYIKDRTYG